MQKSKFNYYLVIDLEATCCDLKKIPRHQMEIIEIGAVMVETTNLKIVSEFQTFINPIRHPILTDFCRELTKISQENVNQAPLFPEAIKTFKQWLDQYDNFIFCSWGNFDQKQFEQDCKFHQIPYPFPCKHLNLKEEFTQAQNLKKKLGMKQALEYVNLTLEGTHHRGIDDARNIAKLLPFMITE